MLVDKFSEARKSAIINSENSRDKSKVQYARKSKMEYNVGDFVFLYNPVVKREVKQKFCKPCVGPYTILEKL